LVPLHSSSSVTTQSVAKFFISDTFLVTYINVLWFGYCTVPFDEDEREATVWFLDHDYLENMYGMFKKVNG